MKKKRFPSLLVSIGVIIAVFIALVISTDDFDLIIAACGALIAFFVLKRPLLALWRKKQDGKWWAVILFFIVNVSVSAFIASALFRNNTLMVGFMITLTIFSYVLTRPLDALMKPFQKLLSKAHFIVILFVMLGVPMVATFLLANIMSQQATIALVMILSTVLSFAVKKPEKING